jgi:3-phosphoshikimate 1-carboxyvinyltransferase
MAHFLVTKSRLKGEITTPPSKSHTLRAILFGSFGKGKSIIHNPLPSTDADAMIQACQNFGADIHVSSQKIEINGINGQFTHAKDVINAGNSGIVLRFCSALGALAHHPVVITGDHSIRYQRPMSPLLEGLTQLGVKTATMRNDGYAPVIIQGPIKNGKAVIHGTDSQPVSALLIAGAFADTPIEIDVLNPGELPWVGLTLNWFDRLGIPYENHSFNRYRLFGNSRFDGFDYHVPGDFSSAAFPIAAALITNSEIMLKNIDMNDCQGDKELIYILQQMGAHIQINEKDKTLHVRSGSHLKGLCIDINNYIDAITIIAVIACYAEGETHIHNAAVAKQKECNRIQCITKELRKMGADITETEDGLIIKNSALKGASVHSHHDHRMAMSLAVAAMGAEGQTCISDVDCISKTFPGFFQEFHSLGAAIMRGS